MWGLHNNQPSLDLVGEGFVAIGWDELGDVSRFADDRDGLKQAIIDAYPTAKPGAVPVWAGVLMRFMNEITVGDVVVTPNKSDSTVDIGVFEGDYYYDPAVEFHRNRRKVRWTTTGLPRAEFTQGARYEIGSAVTLFQVKNHPEEFLRFVDSPLKVDPGTGFSQEPDALSTEVLEDEPSADRIETYSRDFVVDVLRTMDPFRFEHFVAGLLTAMGYRAEATRATGDGGVDVIAYRDPLGLEPPIVKVQCKRTVSTIGAPDVQKLAGALAHGGSEVGLFISLGSFSADAVHLERTRQDLRLITGVQLVDLVFAYYDKLDPEWRRLLPLRSVYVVDRADDLS